MLKVFLVCTVVAYSAWTCFAPDVRTTVSLCTKCGVYETTVEHCLPFTSMAVCRSRSETQTPISLVVQKHQLQLLHKHQFVMASIRGTRHTENGPAIRLKDRVGGPYAHVIDTLATFSDKYSTEQWLDRVLAPNTYFVFPMEMAWDLPREKRREFRKWLDQFQRKEPQLIIFKSYHLPPPPAGQE